MRISRYCDCAAGCGVSSDLPQCGCCGDTALADDVAGADGSERRDDTGPAWSRQAPGQLPNASVITEWPHFADQEDQRRRRSASREMERRWRAGVHVQLFAEPRSVLIVQPGRGGRGWPEQL